MRSTLLALLAVPPILFAVGLAMGVLASATSFTSSSPRR